MNYQPKNPAPTFESVWATLQENAQQMRENAQQMRENTQQMREQFAENERQREKWQEFHNSMKASKEKEEKEWQEFHNSMNASRKKEEQEWEEFRKSMKAMQKEVGGIGHSNGAVAESYFVNSFTKTMQFAGQMYDSMDHPCKRKVKSLNLQGEYDLILYNCTSVVIIEIKYSAEKKHVGWLLKDAAIFKQLFPQYANLDLYLGLAALHFEEDTEKEAINQGIAVIKQVGDNMVIYDEHLKVF